MTPVDPCVPLALLPERTRAIVKAKDQPRYNALPSLHTPAGRVITRWELTDEERRRILQGEDVYLCVLTFNNPLQPVSLTVGVADWSADD